MLLYLAVAFGILSCAVFAAILWHFGLYLYPIRQASSRRFGLTWEDKGEVPLAAKKYTPQGLTWARDRLIFANTWKNTRSRVYEFDPQTMVSERYFDMPQGAVHTSGLAWDGECLWAVDYISNMAYCLDLEASLSSGKACELGRFQTTLRGTSASCLLPWDGQPALAISDFMNSRRTIIVRHRESLAQGTCESHIVFSFRNEGFSQGLELIDGFLYESENKLGTDIINKIDLELLRQTGNSRGATIAQFPAPAAGVEDLAWDGEYLWTSDESVFRFYRARLTTATNRPHADPAA